MKFGENLKNIRKYKKISQEELAERLGVSRQSISKWETGENYPSMTNIMCLCDIFNCPINEFVHEDMVDIDLLDEEIKMNVVKFKKEEQKKMKSISKFIYIVARIFKACAVIGLVTASIMSFAIIGITTSSKIDTNKKQITVLGKKVLYELTEKEFSIINDNKNIVIASDLTRKEVETINNALNLSLDIRITITVLFIISIIGTLIIAIKLTEYLEKLFKNIHDNDTPFNMDNVFYMKKIALYSLLYLLCSDVFGGIAQGISTLDFNIDIELQNYVIAVIILAFSYVFKYGYEIQLDSKGKIYGDDYE